MILINQPIKPQVGFAEYARATSIYTHKITKKILKAEGQTSQEWAQERIDASKGDY